MEKKLPKEFEEKRISLSSLNVGGFAWKREDLISFFEDPRSNEFAILGGDVLSYKNGKLSFTYDNWAAPERPRTEPFSSFCQRTKDTALQYIRSYPKDDDIIFSPFITSEVTAGWTA